MAVAQTPSRFVRDLIVPPQGVVAVLDHMEKPGNIGAVIRSADGAGIDAVVLVEPVTDLFNPNAIRASLGTIFSMQVVAANFEDYASWARTRNIHHLLSKCVQDAAEYRT